MQKNFSASAATFDQFPETENPELILQSKNSEQSPQKLIVEFLQFAGKNFEQILKNPAVENLLTTVGGNVKQIVAFLAKKRGRGEILKNNKNGLSTRNRKSTKNRTYKNTGRFGDIRKKEL